MLKPGPNPTALIVGRGEGSAQAALELARAGVSVTLLTAECWLEPSGPAVIPILLEATRHPRINLVTGATVQAIRNGARGPCVTIRQTPCYVDPARCTACGTCAEVCPVDWPSTSDLAHLRAPVLEGDAERWAEPPNQEGANGASRKAIYRGGVPTTYAIEKAGTAPCRDACPIDQRAQGYIALIAAGDYKAAYDTIRRDNPFPAICGRVCNHRCEDACSRDKVDLPVNIMGLKRFVADWHREHKAHGERSLAFDERGSRDAHEPPPTGNRVAVVGAGPAGLTCALDLVRQGHAVTVFEALPVAGGMMRVGIPAFRLPHHLVQFEIDEILNEGVDLVLNHRVGSAPTLLEDGFDAVFLAVGAHQGLKLPIPGADLPEVLVATDFLQDVSLSDRTSDNGWRSLISGKRVLVLGGGNVAVDAAMITLRLGALWVGMTCLESRDRMPAHDWELRDAEEEGIQVFPSRTFKEVTSREGHVTGVRCAQIRFRGFIDGRPDFDELPGASEVIAADVVIFAIGQRPGMDRIQDKIETMRGRFPVVDPETLATSLPGVFAGGDVVTGTAFIVDAIAAGHRAARSIDSFLWGRDLVTDQPRLPPVELDEAEVRRRLKVGQASRVGRVHMQKRPAVERRKDFGEVYAGLTESEARAEAARCLNCGICSECLTCEVRCPASAISHEEHPHTWDLLTSAVIVVDEGRTGVQREVSSALPKTPGVFWAGAAVDLSSAVQRALAHLDITQPVRKKDIAAPYLRQIAPVSSSVRTFPTRVPPVYATAGGTVQLASPETLQAIEMRAPQLGVILCRCGGEIEKTVNLSAVSERVARLPGVSYVGRVDFACHPEGNEAIRALCASHGLDGATLAACSCCGLDHICFSCTTQRTRCKERLGIWEDTDGFPVQFVNLREQCAFVHPQDATAVTLKAGDIVAAGVAGLSIAIGQRRIGMAKSRLPISADIDLARCRGCEDCESICGLEAIRVVHANGARIARVDPSRCLGCGVCTAVCSSGAISAGDTSDVQVEAKLAAMGDLNDKTVIFTCNWGAYSAVESAGVARLSYDPSVRVLRLLCAGRAHDGLIMRAFVQGAARVLVLTCGHEDNKSQCYYGTGNDQARRSVEQTRRLLQLLGIDPARLGVVELRPGDGAQFVAALQEFSKVACTVSPEGRH